MEDILANTKGRTMRMCSRSVGEDVWCTEVKTHEVELILKKNPFWILQMKTSEGYSWQSGMKNLSHNVGDSQS